MTKKTLRDLKAALDALPRENADYVSNELNMRGIPGHMNSPCECPLANYLRVETGLQWDVFNDGDGDYYVDNGRTYATGADRRYECVELADYPAIVDFVRLFDRGEYPALQQ